MKGNIFPLVACMYCCAKTSSQKLKTQLGNLEKVASFSNEIAMKHAPQKISRKSWK